MPFLKNAWYCAGWAHELEDGKHFARKLLNEFVLVFRKQDGEVAAMSNVCPHRFAPMHKGPRKGDTFACPYHGLEFDASGTCTLNPNQGGKIPKAATLKTYPLVEKWSALWIWMGDAERADESLIPDFSMTVEREGWSVVRGHHTTHAHYELVVDNLMDRTHVQFLHPLLKHGGGEIDGYYQEQSVEQDGNTVWDRHAEYNCPKYMLLGALWPDAPELTMNYFDVRWDAPSNMLLDSGTCEMDTDRKVGSHTPMANLITPASDDETHYFWSQARDLNIDNPEIDEKIRQGVAHTFKNEDGQMVADCYEQMGSSDLLSLNPVLLATDAGAMRVRRILSKLIEAERNEEAAKVAAE